MLPTFVCFSQNSFGIRGGNNYNTASISKIFSTNDTISTNYRSGFTGGLYLDLKVSKRFSIETNLQYSENETDLTIDSLSGGGYIENGIITTRTELPLLGKFRFGSQLLKIGIFAGPNFSFQQKRTQEKRTFGTGPDEIPIDRTEIEKSTYDTFQYRNLVGFGVSIHLNQVVIFGDYRYNFNFNAFDSIRQDGFVESLGSNIGLGIGYSW